MRNKLVKIFSHDASPVIYYLYKIFIEWFAIKVVCIIANKKMPTVRWHHFVVKLISMLIMLWSHKFYWSFHVFPYTAICWGRKENFPSKWMIQVISEMFSRFSIFMGIFMFFSSYLYVSSGLANAQFFTSTCPMNQV